MYINVFHSSYFTLGLSEVTPMGESRSALGTERGVHWDSLFHPWESPTLRSADKCCRCLSFLLPLWRWQGNSHATIQCLNKRVCLIQLSPQACAKWALVLCDRDNEQRARRGEGVQGWWWVVGTWRERFKCFNFTVFLYLGFNFSWMTQLI